MSEPYRIVLEEVDVTYPLPEGGSKTILNNVNLRIRAGEFVSLVGPTGCGKSTLLRMILGSQAPTSGRVLVDGEPVTGVGRDRGIVFQRYSLFPHLSVQDNIAFGPLLEECTITDRVLLTPSFRRARARHRAAARDLVLEIGLAPGDAGKYPHQLSGGMQQRVAIAQALIMRPSVLLMDEPFGALDHNTRSEMQLLLLEQWKVHRTTILFVTHDLEEACFVGSRIIALSQHWFYDGGESGRGAVIVCDRLTPGGHPKPTAVTSTVAFLELLDEVKRSALDPDGRNRISQFDIDHADAMPSRPDPAVEASADA